eukprot:COSAG02_NODE_60339_length_271_cov_1.191860_1_plen_33_part_01
MGGVTAPQRENEVVLDTNNPVSSTTVTNKYVCG